METLQWATIILLVLLNFTIIAGLVFGYYFFKNYRTTNNSDDSTPQTRQDILEILGDNDAFCKLHPKTEASGTCAICLGSFCETCIKNHETLMFCPTHYKVFLEHKWQDIQTVKTTPNNPHDGVQLYEYKKELWTNEEIPAYVMTHYKLNYEGDYIESYIMLFVRDIDVDRVAKIGSTTQH